ncbi:MAG: PD40 domain-containing protein [Flavobacteriales bacterium]|nr:PD40 domain-containing protein [Flavobacteriales bacterium]
MRLFLFSLIAVLVSGKSIAQQDTCDVCEIELINSNFDEFFPVFPDSSTMIFTSSRRNPLSEKVVANVHNLYISTYSDDQWTEPKLLNYLTNSDNNEASAGLSASNNTLYLYKTFNGGDIYYTTKKGKGKWSAPKKMNFNTPYHESSACRCNNTVYFVSDKPGGKGNHDLYSTVLEDGKWTDPENISILNTEYDEHYVSTSADCQTIYFSSKGHDAIGEYDVFKAELGDDLCWSSPINMGETINTDCNEISFSQDARSTIYFASDRYSEKTAGYNIYYRNLEKKVTMKVPLLFFDYAPLEEAGLGELIQVKDSVEAYGYRKDFPKYVLADISYVVDSTQIMYVKDLIVNGEVKLMEDENDPIYEIKMLPKKKEPLSLEEVKEVIDFEIKHFKIQVGTFFYIRSISNFTEKFPLLTDKVIMISTPGYSRFLMKETLTNLDSAAVLQKKCMQEYNSVSDTFIAVYDSTGKRIIIYFDVRNEKYMLLKPKDQTMDIDPAD